MQNEKILLYSSDVIADILYRLMDNRLLQSIGRAGDVCPAGGGAKEGCNNTLTIDIMEREIGIEIANPAQKKCFWRTTVMR